MTDVQNTLPEVPSTDQDKHQQLPSKRKKALSIVGLLLLMAVVIFAIWKLFLIIGSVQIMLM